MFAATPKTRQCGTVCFCLLLLSTAPVFTILHGKGKWYHPLAPQVENLKDLVILVVSKVLRSYLD